jgi:hypothetical protein
MGTTPLGRAQVLLSEAKGLFPFMCHKWVRACAMATMEMGKLESLILRQCAQAAICMECKAFPKRSADLCFWNLRGLSNTQLATDFGNQRLASVRHSVHL